jgi:hypothetical protein
MLGIRISWVTERFLALSTLAFLFHSATATADCIKPAWTDPLSLKHLDRAASTSYVFEFQARVHEFIACQRGSLEKRTRGLAPSEVRRVVLGDRETEDRALAEVIRLDSCLGFARRESDPVVARTKCEDFIKWALDERRPRQPPVSTELKTEQRNEYGGFWSFQTLDLGRPGNCDDAPCDILFAVEVTNTTPVALRCEVALVVSNRQDGTHRGEQVITLYPGDSLPAARVRIRRSPEGIEPDVMCSRAVPLVLQPGVSAACVLNWLPRAFEYPRGFSLSAWESGAAVVEFATQEGHKPAVAIDVVQAEPSAIGGAARALIEKLNFSTNCPGQRFRLRVEYRAFPCYGCSLENGVVTLLRDDRQLQ